MKMECGGLCVMVFGISQMSQWFVISWAMHMHSLLQLMLPLVKAVDQYGWMMRHVLEMSRPYSTVLTVALVCITVGTTVMPVLFATKVSSISMQSR